MKPINQLAKTMKGLLTSGKVKKMIARLGNLQGAIQVEMNNVWVSLLDGEELVVRNDRVPNYVQWVWVGQDEQKPGVLQVLSAINTYQSAFLPHLPDHDHTWGKSTNPTWIRGEQFLPGLAIPSSGMIVQFYGLVYYLNGFHVLDSQQIDLSAYVPLSGALWGLVEADAAGAISLLQGASTASRELLEYEDIPNPSINKFPLFAVKLYYGQTEIIKNYNDTDIVDPRFTGISTSGMIGLLGANRVVVTDASGAITTDSEITYDPTAHVLSIGDWGTPEFAGASNVMYLHGDNASPVYYSVLYSDTAAQAPRFVGMRGNGTKAVPASAVADITLAQFGGRGAIGTAWSSTVAEMRIIANENIGGSNMGGRIEWWMIPDTTITSQRYLTLKNDGTLETAIGGMNIPTGKTYNVNGVPQITGGGTIALGGFTLTVPATGTAALLGVANIFTQPQKITLSSIAAGEGGLWVTSSIVDGTGGGIFIDVPVNRAALRIRNEAAPRYRADLLIDGANRPTLGTFDDTAVEFLPMIYNAKSHIFSSGVAAATPAFTINSNNTTVFTSTLTITPSTDVVGLIINKSTTADALNVKNGATILAAINTSGDIIGNKGATGYVTLGGLPVDRSWGGLWLAQASPSASNYIILANAAGGAGGGTQINTVSGSNMIFKVANGEQMRINSDGGLLITGSANRIQLSVLGFTTQAVATAMAQITRTDAAAGVSAMLDLTALGSGANGDGGSILLNGKSSTTVAQAMALFDWRWIDATHASRKAALRLYAYDTAARLGIEIEASGSGPKLSFYGGTTVVRGAALTPQLTTITFTAPGTPDYAIQDFAQNGGAGIWGFADHDEANSMLKVIANLQVRVAEVEARLGSATGVNLFA